MHTIEVDPEELAKIKKNIDYEMINRYSTGKVTFREYIFQEKIPSIPVSPLNSTSLN